MNKPVIYMDQTVNEGLRRNIRSANLQLMLKATKELQVGYIDVVVSDWEKSGLRSCNMGNYFFRGNIRPNMHELYKAYHLGFDKISIFCPHVSRKSNSKKLYPLLEAATRLNLDIFLHIENAAQISAVDIDFYLKLLVKFNIKSFIYGDKEGRLDSFQVYKALNYMAKVIPCSLEFHGHNMYGMATSNALAAIRAGVGRIATAIGGVGERGHAAMEEVLLGSKHLLKKTVDIDASLASNCAHILACMGLKVPVNKAIIGTGIFTHESGLHVDGVVKDPSLYEAFSPEEVGLIRKLVIGKHSGSVSLRVKLQQMNIQATDEEIRALLPKIRKLAVLQKGNLGEEQIRKIYDTELARDQ